MGLGQELYDWRFGLLRQALAYETWPESLDHRPAAVDKVGVIVSVYSTNCCGTCRATIMIVADQGFETDCLGGALNRPVLGDVFVFFFFAVSEDCCLLLSLVVA